jgi:hypothetical protein
MRRVNMVTVALLAYADKISTPVHVGDKGLNSARTEPVLRQQAHHRLNESTNPQNGFNNYNNKYDDHMSLASSTSAGSGKFQRGKQDSKRERSAVQKQEYSDVSLGKGSALNGYQEQPSPQELSSNDALPRNYASTDTANSRNEDARVRSDANSNSRQSKRLYASGTNSSFNIASIRNKYGKPRNVDSGSSVTTSTDAINTPPAVEMDAFTVWSRVDEVDDINNLESKYDEIFARVLQGQKQDWYTRNNWDELVASSGDKYYYSRDNESVQWEDPFFSTPEYAEIYNKKLQDLELKKHHILSKRSVSPPADASGERHLTRTGIVSSTSSMLTNTTTGGAISSTAVTPSNQVYVSSNQTNSVPLQKKKSGMRTVTVDANTGLVSDTMAAPTDSGRTHGSVEEHYGQSSAAPGPQSSHSGGNESLFMPVTTRESDEVEGKVAQSAGAAKSSARRNPFLRQASQSSQSNDNPDHDPDYSPFGTRPPPSRSHFRSDSTSSPVSDLSDGTASASQSASQSASAARSSANNSDRHMQIWERFFSNALQSRMASMGADEGDRLHRRHAGKHGGGKKSSKRPSTNSQGSSLRDADYKSAAYGPPPTSAAGVGSVGSSARGKKKDAEPHRTKIISIVGSPAGGHTRWTEPMPLPEYLALIAAALNKTRDSSNSLVSESASTMSDYKHGLLNEALLAATCRGDTHNMEQLLVHGAHVDCVDAHIRAPCHHASKLGDVTVLAVLQDQNSDFNAQDCNGRTPLHVAAHFGNLFAIRFLLECAVDIDGRDIAGNTPLHLAVRIGSLSCVQLLVEYGADINTVNSAGLDPLSVALAATPQTEELQQVEEYLILHKSRLEAGDNGASEGASVSGPGANASRWQSRATPYDRETEEGEDFEGSYPTQLAPSTPTKPWTNLIVDTSPAGNSRIAGRTSVVEYEKQMQQKNENRTLKTKASKSEVVPSRDSAGVKRDAAAVWKAAVNDAVNSKHGTHKATDVDNEQSYSKNTMGRPPMGKSQESKFPQIDFPRGAPPQTNHSRPQDGNSANLATGRRLLSDEDDSRTGTTSKPTNPKRPSDIEESDEDEDQQDEEDEDDLPSGATGLTNAVNGVVWGLATSLIGASLSMFGKDANKDQKPKRPVTPEYLKKKPVVQIRDGTGDRNEGVEQPANHQSTGNRSPTINTARMLYEASHGRPATAAAPSDYRQPTHSSASRDLPGHGSAAGRGLVQSTANISDSEEEDHDDEDEEEEDETPDEGRVAMFTRRVLGGLLSNVKSLLPSANRSTSFDATDNEQSSNENNRGNSGRGRSISDKSISPVSESCRKCTF